MVYFAAVHNWNHLPIFAITVVAAGAFHHFMLQPGLEFAVPLGPVPFLSCCLSPTTITTYEAKIQTLSLPLLALILRVKLHCLMDETQGRTNTVVSNMIMSRQ